MRKVPLVAPRQKGITVLSDCGVLEQLYNLIFLCYLFFMTENDDIIVRGGGQIVMIVIIRDENDDDSGRPLRTKSTILFDSPRDHWSFSC